MYEFRLHTLVDLTENGNLKQSFPFKTKSDEVIHDKHTLAVARNQNNNFDTMIQLLQMRGNVTWEHSPMKITGAMTKFEFGTFYEGQQTAWHFQFFTEQMDVYGDELSPTESLLDDFHNVPIISFCKETVTFPLSTFDTQNPKTINTYFSFAGEYNK